MLREGNPVPMFLLHRSVQRRVALTGLLLLSTLLWMPTSQAEPLPRDERERACWLAHTRERTRVKLNEPTSVDFANLKDGYVTRSPFQVDFAIRGMGVVPAGKPHPKAGHHHLLVNTPLPANVGEKIPFNDFHRHFGKGQTGTTIALPPGKHKLRLLFADHDHRPYFVFSPDISVTVSGPRTPAGLKLDDARNTAACDAWYQDELTRPRPEGQRLVFTNLREGEPVPSPFNLRLAVDGFGVAPRGHGGEGLGHFMLDIRSGTRVVQQIDLSNGATQVNLFLNPGPYSMRLRFLDDQGAERLPAAELSIVVTALERL
jgi:hypothetical protein